MKDAYIQQIITTATALAQSFDNANVLINVYFDRGYNSGGANELTSADLESTNLTVGQVASAITLFQQLQALRSGGTISAGDYDATLNTLRRDV